MELQRDVLSLQRDVLSLQRDVLSLQRDVLMHNWDYKSVRVQALRMYGNTQLFDSSPPI